MGAQHDSMLSLIVVIVIALVIYVVLLKLMWDWQQRTSHKEPTSDQFLVVLATTALIGILTFIGYIILTGPKDANQFNMLILWALAVEVLLTSYVAYFHHDLKTESGYLLMILLVLFVILILKLGSVNKYGAIASFFGGSTALFLHLKAMRDVEI